MISIYQLKPYFQNVLRPLVRWLASHNITANQITIIAMLISIIVGTYLCLHPQHFSLFLLLPIWMFFRMAFNAIDGMLAREFQQQSHLGAYLNELSDVISDAILYLPFIFISPFNGWSIGLIIFLSTLSEMTGALGPMIGSPRRYDGPMGKSDRAFIFGALGLWLGIHGSLPAWIIILIPFIIITILINIKSRIFNAILFIQQQGNQ